jgi:hypothetical protein
MLSGVWLLPCHARSIRSADVQRAVGLERHVGQGHGPGRVVVPGQQPLGLDVPHSDHVAAEQRRCADVVGMVVRVDDVGHLVGHAGVGRDLVDGALQVASDARGRVEQHHPLPGGQEGRLVGAIGDPVQILLYPPGVIALRVDGRAQRGRRYGRVVGQRIGRRRFGEGAPGQAGDRGDSRDRRAAREERASVQR